MWHTQQNSLKFQHWLHLVGHRRPSFDQLRIPSNMVTSHTAPPPSTSGASSSTGAPATMPLPTTTTSFTVVPGTAPMGSAGPGVLPPPPKPVVTIPSTSVPAPTLPPTMGLTTGTGLPYTQADFNLYFTQFETLLTATLSSRGIHPKEIARMAMDRALEALAAQHQPPAAPPPPVIVNPPTVPAPTPSAASRTSGPPLLLTLATYFPAA